MIYFTLTIDVEPDCTPTWHYSNPLTFNGVTYGIQKILQPLFNQYNITPTYLINNVVLENEESISTFQKLDGLFELGTHLHSEFIEPEKKYYDYAGKKGEANQCFLSSDIEFEKMKNITNLFREKFGYSPVSFRAGRFSARKNTLVCLEKLGYKVDTSVTPHINWNDETREQPVDYRNANEQPYFDGKILEIPISITQQKRLLLKNKTIWLRPFYSTYKEMNTLVEEYEKKYRENKHIVFNMMFHNVEILPNKSPYTKTQNDVARYLESLELFFQLCNKKKMESIALSQLYDIYKK